MIEVEAEARKWGNSLGIIIPNEVVEREGIREHEKVNLLLVRDSRKTLKELFGKVQLKKSSQKLKDEIRKELYD